MQPGMDCARILVGRAVEHAPGMIDDARWQLRPDVMVAGMITIAMIGWVMENWAFDWLERVTIERWGMTSTR